MISGDPFLLLGDHLALFLCTDANLDKGILNIFLANKYMTFSGCSNSRLIHQVLKICTCKSSCSLSDLFQVYILAKRFILGMNMEDFFPSFNIRTTYANLAVKTSRTKNCRIQNIHTVGSGHYDNAFIYPESIHLYKKLVQSLFPFIMTASHAGSTLSCNSIDLINKDDTRCVTLALFEKISYTGSTYTNKHFHKIRTGNGEKRNARFPGNSLGQKRLTSSWRSYKDNSFRDSGPHLGILLGILQEIYNLLQLLLLFLQARYVLESHFLIIRHGHSRPAFAEIHHLGIGATTPT